VAVEQPATLYPAFGQRLAEAGDLYRAPAYASGLLLASPCRNIKPTEITRPINLARIIVDRVPVTVIDNGKEKGERERRATAYHEAGHAVMSVELRLVVASVNLHRDEHQLGVCRGGGALPQEEDFHMPNGKTRRWVEREIMVLLAGSEAEAMFTGRKNHLGARSDLHSAVDLASTVCNTVDEVQAYLLLLAIRARDLLATEHLWAAVVAVAEALLERGELKGREVRRIVRRAIAADLPAPVAGRPPRARRRSQNARP
jgi:hypothetical protein